MQASTPKIGPFAPSAVPVLTGIDTLVLTYLAPVPEALIARLEPLKLAATAKRDTNDATPTLFTVGDAPFEVQASGTAPWKFRLELRDRVTLHIAGRSMLTEGTPTIKAELHAVFLWADGWEAAVARVQMWCFDLLAEPESWLERVSRIDLCADFQGWHPSGTDREVLRFRTDARRSFDRRGMPGRVQTMSWGLGGPLGVRLYNKSAEILVSKKLWFRALWARHRAYECGAPVYRLECQLRGEALDEMGLRADWNQNVRPNLDRIWRYMFGRPDWRPELESPEQAALRSLQSKARRRRLKGATLDPHELVAMEELTERCAMQRYDADAGGWLTLRAPSNDSNTRRHPIADPWRDLQRVDFGDRDARRAVREEQREADAENLRAQIAGLLSSLAIVERIPIPPPGATEENEIAMARATQQFVIRQRIHDAKEERTFAERSREKQRKRWD